MDEDARDVDPDGTDVRARSAERRGERQRARLLDPDELRSDDRADRTRIDGAVGVAARSHVHRADVEACRAADAAQRLPPHLVRERVGAAVVEQDQVKLLRPVAFVHAGPERRVRVHALGRRRSRQQLQKDLEVLERRDDLLDPHDRDQRLGQGRAHAPVALRLDDADGAGRRDREVRAADPDAGAEEALAEVAPRRLGERFRLVRQLRDAKRPQEELADLRAVLVEQERGCAT
jgi:hypothetical protein